MCRKFYNLSLHKINTNNETLPLVLIEFSCICIIIVTFSFDAIVV